jgi:hypothetical protein
LASLVWFIFLVKVITQPGFRGTVLKEYCQVSWWNVS